MADKLETTASMEPSVAELKEDIARLREDLAKLVGTVGETAKAGLKGARADAGAAAGEAGDWAEAQYHNMRTCIREQPITSCAIAAGVGFVLGQILLRR